MEFVVMRNVKLSEDDSSTGTASVSLHTCPRRGELVEGPSYILMLSVSQLEAGANLLKKHGENYLSSLRDIWALWSPQHTFDTKEYLEAIFSCAVF